MKLKTISIGLIALVAQIATSQGESKLSFNGMAGIQNGKGIVLAFGAYDIASIENVFGSKLKGKIRVFTGLPLSGVSTVSGGGDIGLAGQIGANAEGFVGVGYAVILNQSPAWGLTGGVRVWIDARTVAVRVTQKL